MASFTKLTLYKNTAFTNMQNTLHFSSNEERDSWFNSYSEQLNFSTPFNFRRDRGTLKIGVQMDKLNGYNYMRFKTDGDPTTYYAYIIQMTYLNEKVTQLDIVIDCVMTFTQGTVLEDYTQGCEIIRQHYPYNFMQDCREELKLGDPDAPKPQTLKIVHNKKHNFDRITALIFSNVDLDRDFGTVDKPVMTTATGGTIDGIRGVRNIYKTDPSTAGAVMEHLRDYPWISQNISKVLLVPQPQFENHEGGSKNITVSNSSFQLEKLVNSVTVPSIALDDLTVTTAELREWMGLASDGTQDYLISDGNVTMELTDYRSHKLQIQISLLQGHGVTFSLLQHYGYHNEFTIIVNNYGNRRGVTSDGIYRDSSLSFTDFDSIETLLDNGTLNKANTAYTRSLNNQRQLTGRVNTLTNKNASVKDRLMSALSIYSNVFSGGLSGSIARGASLYNDEYEYYRDQQAQMKQWGITPPTVTEGTYGYMPLKKTNDYGFYLKISVPEFHEMGKIKRYYGMFGFNDNGISERIHDITSMSYCNWVQFRGSWIIPNVDINLMLQLQTLLEGGVRLFHSYDQLKHPDYENNKVKK